MRGPYQGAISPTMPSTQVPGVVARPAPPMPPPVATAPVKGLPADAPPLVINGGVYSANPKNRLVIVNGQVVREGADLGSGVTLEQINPAGVVVGFRGAHYKLMY
jgi:general secretion pathway protein B